MQQKPSPTSVRRSLRQVRVRQTAYRVMIATALATGHAAMYEPGKRDPSYIPDVTPSPDHPDLKVCGLQRGDRPIVEFRENRPGGGYVVRRVRLCRDGTQDPTFRIAPDLQPELDRVGQSSSAVSVVRVVGDETVMVAFNTQTNNTVWRLYRLHADGDRDTAFGPTEFHWFGTYTGAFVPLQDGEFLVTKGWFPLPNGEGRGPARLHRDGSVDGTYKPPSVGSVFAVLPDGSASYFATERSGTESYTVLGRLKADGRPDEGFPVVRMPPEVSADVIPFVAPDGKLIVWGFNYQTSRSFLLRLHSDGRADGSFVPDFVPWGPAGVSQILPQPDGKLLAGGRVESGYGIGVYSIVWRMYNDGAVDLGFRTFFKYGSDLAVPVSLLAQLEDGGILAAGSFEGPDLVRLQGGDFRLWERTRFADLKLQPPSQDVRLSLVGPPGQPVGVEKSSDLEAWEPLATTTLVEGEGAVMDSQTVASARGFYRAVELPLEDPAAQPGAVDRSFDLRPEWDYPVSVSAAACGPDGAVYLGYVAGWGPEALGKYPRAYFGLARFQPDGQPDPAFAVPLWQGKYNNLGFEHPRLLALYPDGRVLCSHGPGPRVIARFQADGTLDPEYAPAITLLFDWAGCGWGNIRLLLPLADGKVIVVGGFDSVDGQRLKGIARLQPDGRLDPSFRPDPNVSGRGIPYCWSPGLPTVFDAVLVGERLMIAGDFTHIDGKPRPGIARLNQDGSLDLSFEPAQFSAGSEFRALAVVNDKVLAAGRCQIWSSTQWAYGVFRLNEDGSLDQTFTPWARVGASGSSDLVLLSGGRLAVRSQLSVGGPSPIKEFVLLGPGGERQESFRPSLELWPSFTVGSPRAGLLLAGCLGGYPDYTYPNLPRAYVVRVLLD